MRITTNAILRNYKSNLASSMDALNTSRTHVMTQRSFNSVAEDPASAARASQLHRRYYQNQDNLRMLDDVQARQDGQEDALMQISKVVRTISKDYNLQAVNGTNGVDERKTFASAIREYQKSMVLSLNASYEDNYLFAGADGRNVPFELKDDGNLYYRGINVDAPQNSADEAALKKLSMEHTYVDLGMGLTLDAIDRVVPSSAFDTALPGINAIGYGKDNDGMSNNAVVLAGQLADMLEKEPFDANGYDKLIAKFDTVSTRIMNNVTELGVKTDFLTTTKDRLENTELSLQKQMSTVEGIDMAEGITDYMWNQYAYNAALKVGTSILSPSFIDFMK